MPARRAARLLAAPEDRAVNLSRPAAIAQLLCVLVATASMAGGAAGGAPNAAWAGMGALVMGLALTLIAKADRWL